MYCVRNNDMYRVRNNDTYRVRNDGAYNGMYRVPCAVYNGYLPGW